MMFNGVAILNNDRFLEKCACVRFFLPPCAHVCLLSCAAALKNQHKHNKRKTKNKNTDGFGFSQMSQANGLKMSIIGGIHAVHYFRGARLLLCVVLCVLLLFCVCAGCMLCARRR